MENILIYDDNIEDCLELKNFLYCQLETNLTNIDTAVSYAMAEELLANKHYDIIFIDIELDNQKNGIDFTVEFQKKISGCQHCLYYCTYKILPKNISYLSDGFFA